MYALIQQGNVVKWPYSLADMLTDNPSVSFAFPMSESDLNEWGVYTVEEVPEPTVDDNFERVEQVAPKLVNEKWTQQWDVIPLSEKDQEIKWYQQKGKVREDRGRRLAECDWTQLPDAPLSADQKETWVVYRQALRDITEQAGFPFNVTWPNRPVI